MRIDRHQKILACLVALVALPAASFAAGGEAHVMKANNDIRNQASLQRGAKNFVNYCLACHSAKYVRYNRMASDLGLDRFGFGAPSWGRSFLFRGGVLIRGWGH